MKVCVICGTEFNAKKTAKCCSPECMTVNEKKVARQTAKRYYAKNKERLCRKARDRFENDPHYKLVVNARNLIVTVLNGKVKHKHTIELLGCTVEEYKKQSIN